jgi:hypothetical protein
MDAYGNCGDGAPCEAICPLRKPGRRCPGVLEALHMAAQIGPLETIEDLLRPASLVA